jgi:hypothetical protein
MSAVGYVVIELLGTPGEIDLLFIFVEQFRRTQSFT